MIKLIKEPFSKMPDGFYYFRPCNNTGEDDLAEIRTAVNDPVRGEQVGFIKYHHLDEELQERYLRDVEQYKRTKEAIDSGAHSRKIEKKRRE